MEILIVIAAMFACAYKAWVALRMIIAVVVVISIAILVTWKLRKWIKKEKDMNRTCKGCYAAKSGGHPLQGTPNGCRLGYNTDGHGKPLEECPKPKSWRAAGKAKAKGE